MDKDTLEELESAFRQMSEGMQEVGLGQYRIKKVLEKMQERERLLGITREVEDFENPILEEKT